MGVWTKKVKHMTISLHNQDPIEIQRMPRYGRGDIIRGTIEFDEGRLAALDRVELVVRLLPITGRSLSFV
jgi:hypothetical protein